MCPRSPWFTLLVLATLGPPGVALGDEDTEFYERHIRPLLVKHCYECHSEQGGERQGGLLLDRREAWLAGGDTGQAVVPGEPEESLLITAVKYEEDDLQMPPEAKLDDASIRLLENWIKRGAPGPEEDLGETEFSRLGDQKYLFGVAETHWAFQPVEAVELPDVSNRAWNENAVDRLVFDRLQRHELQPSGPAEPRVLLRRLTYDLTGLPPTFDELTAFESAAAADRETAVREVVDRLLASPAFGEHLGRMWLDVARYADTDSFYRPDTKTPHYFPFAFTYRDYVVEAFNADEPFDRFVTEQLAADLLDGDDPARLAALGFLGVGPHANRNQGEAIDDWIDTTTRGFLGLTVACARCHDHKFEPIPTTDYYALHGVFSSVQRVDALADEELPPVPGYEPSAEEVADYERQRTAIDAKIEKAGGSKTGGNNKPVAEMIRETELAELLLFHPGAPARAMVVREKPRPTQPVVFLRGDPRSKGESVPRRFPTLLDPAATPFPADASGRLQLAERIVDPANPLTARVFVNRVWGFVTGSYLVDTPSDFGLQGSSPTHPELLDWLAADFVAHGWSTKHLVRTIVLTRTYQQRSHEREEAAAVDPTNRLLWRAERRHLSIEALRDSLLAVSGQLDRTPRGRTGQLWGKDYTPRRSIYGYVNRFNLDPTLRAFDFPSPMQSQGSRGESIVAPQALFTMNAPFVVDQAVAVTRQPRFTDCSNDDDRIAALFEIVLTRPPVENEVVRVRRFLELEKRFENDPKKSPGAETWPLVAQSLMMGNEFQYVD